MFNRDVADNLWFLESDGDLWEVRAGPRPTRVLRGTGPAGAFSLSGTGVVAELKPNGDLRRFANGAWSAPLAGGVTAADVDAAGNVYGLTDGDLLKWAPGQAAATLLNTGRPGVGGGTSCPSRSAAAPSPGCSATRTRTWRGCSSRTPVPPRSG